MKLSEQWLEINDAFSEKVSQAVSEYVLRSSKLFFEIQAYFQIYYRLDCFHENRLKSPNKICLMSIERKG